MKKIIYYWSPCLTKVGTVKSTLNSALALAKYNSNYDVRILNVFGEWNIYDAYLKERGVKLENLTFSYNNILPKYGFIQSRLSYCIIFFLSFIPLIRLLKKKKPDYLIAHLITSLPLILYNLFTFKTKLILRISGYPKLGFIRKYLWSRSNDEIYKITCPTSELIKDLNNQNVFLKDKVFLLTDAILNIEDFINKKKEKITESDKKLPENFFLSVGRFTKQKNFNYLVDEFKRFSINYPNEKLLIIGEGELKKEIEKKIISKKLSNNIFLLNQTNNVFYFMKKAKAFILPSLWEEPGFVIVEAAMSNTFVISSNCKNGPKEFLSSGDAGFLFESNKKGALEKSLNFFMVYNNKDLLKKKILAKKNSTKFSMFRHQVLLKKLID